jgi:hypothetical protein
LDGIFELLGDFGWREAVVLCIVLATIYFVVMVLRYLQLPRQDVYRMYDDLRAPEMRTPPPEFDALPGTALAGVWESPTEPRLDVLRDPLAESPRFPPSPSASGRAATEAYAQANHAQETPPAADLRAAAAPAPGAGFAAQLTQKTLESEVRQLRDQLSESREEIRRMREEMSKLSAAQKVSPLYNEAMALAVRGVDAAGVAGRCGISIAEAELVVALSKRPDGD